MRARYRELLRLIRSVTHPKPGEDHPTDAGKMAGGFLELYLQVRSRPHAASGLPHRAFLRFTAPMMKRAIHAIDLVLVADLENLLRCAWYTDEWKRVCRLRSGLAAMAELYRETSAGPELAGIDLEAVDELIRQRGQDEGYLRPHLVPEGIPPEHWWWWYPGPVA